MKKTVWSGLAAALVLTSFALPVLGNGLLFEKQEYAARRARLMEAIPDGAAILLGAQPVAGYNPYFQNNLLYFLFH